MLLIVLPKRTWDDYKKFADCVVAQPLNPKRLVRSPELSRLCFCLALELTALGSLSKIKPIMCCSAFNPTNFGEETILNRLRECSANQPHHSDHLNQTNHSSFCMHYCIYIK
jgi:hypothetical protein